MIENSTIVQRGEVIDYDRIMSDFPAKLAATVNKDTRIVFTGTQLIQVVVTLYYHVSGQVSADAGIAEFAPIRQLAIKQNCRYTDQFMQTGAQWSTEHYIRALEKAVELAGVTIAGYQTDSDADPDPKYESQSLMRRALAEIT